MHLIARSADEMKRVYDFIFTLYNSESKITTLSDRKIL